MTEHNSAYRPIRIEQIYAKDKDFYSLLPTLDYPKLNYEYLKESILLRKDRNNQIPQIDLLYILDINEEKSSNNQ